MRRSSHRFVRLLSFLAISQLTSLVAFAQTVELTGHGEKIHGVAFSPDGKTLATASFDDTIKLWDFNTRKELLTLKGHVRVYCVAFNNDGTLLASGGDDKSIRIWDPK